LTYHLCILLLLHASAPPRDLNSFPTRRSSDLGLEAWKQALDYGVKVTGCTVHFVDQGIDTGPILAQQTVPVLDDDTPATLHERIDRKSTRLNSSHLGISYAVFCLKKKKEIYTT